MTQRSWRIARTLWGYRSAAARSMLTAYAGHCGEEEQRLIGRVQELRDGSQRLRQAAQADGCAEIPAARPGGGPAGVAAVAELAYQGLGMALFGFDPTDLRRVGEALRASWAERLGALQAELSGLEAERSALLTLIGSSMGPRTLSGLLSPVQELAAAVSVLPFPAEDRPLPARPSAVLRLVSAAGAASGQSPRRGWRPGAVEDDAAADPFAQGPKRPAAGGRIQPRVREQAGPPSPAAEPDPESVHVPSPAPEPRPAPAPPPVPEPGAAAPQESGAQVEVGVRQRLQLLFERFLAGKVVGADLVTADGEPLAVRGTAISYELIRKAEATGVLPSLIAHMTLPGMAGEQEVAERGPGRPV